MVQVVLEADRLLRVEQLEVSVFGVFLEPIQGLRNGVHSHVAVTLRFLQIAKILAFDSFVFLVVLSHHCVSCLKSLFTQDSILLLNRDQRTGGAPRKTVHGTD